MEFFLAWMLFASVQLAATMSPGPAFAVAVRNAVKYGRVAGVFTAIGLGVGVAVHVALVLWGLAAVLAQVEWLFALVKYAGAAYLFYIGIKALKAKPDGAALKAVSGGHVYQHIPILKAFWIGVLTNALNPKAVVFFTAVFSQFIDPSAGLDALMLYGGTSVAVEVLWFAGLSIVLTVPAIANIFRRVQHWVERVCGGLLMALGVKLALSKI